MHASIEQLLNIRDDDAPEAAVVEHVGHCGECAAELKRLRAVRAGLRALPAYEPPPNAWEAIRTRKAEQQRPAPRRWPVPTLALSASVVIAVVLMQLFDQPVTVEETPAEVAAVPGGRAAALPPELLLESQRLEQVLRALSQQPRVMRADTAWTISELEDRIALVDEQLTYASQLGLKPEQSRRLLEGRVDLMNSLVHVRYAQVQRTEY